MSETGPRASSLQNEGPSALERAMVELVAASVTMAPEELPTTVRAAGALLGGRDIVVLQVDLSQRELIEIDGPARLGVEGSPAGEAFRREVVVVEDAGPDGLRVWVPIMDSAERMGVMGATVDRFGDRERHEWSVLGGLLGEILVGKNRYGDGLAMARRTAPLTLAAEMRWSMLPPLTYTAPGLVVSGLLEPAYDVAGDTFDYAVARDHAQVALFDAMGHGLEACRMSNLVVHSYRHSRRLGLDLLETVAAMDQVIEEGFGDHRFVTGQVATLDRHRGLLHMVNAGHPPAVVFHTDGTRDELATATSRPLGLQARPPAPVEVALRPGDVVLMHTDGVTEARSVRDGFFGAERLHDVVADALARRLRPPEVLRAAVSALLAHQQHLRDDATLLLLAWQPGEEAISPVVRDERG